VSENQKISALELGEQNIRSDISTMNEQLASITNNLNAMNTKMAELNGIMTNLSNKIEQQSREIEQKVVTQRQTKRAYYPSHPAHGKYNKYYIQAVIPGRAWLMAMNGATLTVREGTLVPGYGMVKLIDPNQGRVLTSSGQVIKFSQNDS
jgi:intracellular multiplication protein IcmG